MITKNIYKRGVQGGLHKYREVWRDESPLPKNLPLSLLGKKGRLRGVKPLF
jgi:hypothetical protein